LLVAVGMLVAGCNNSADEPTNVAGRDVTPPEPPSCTADCDTRGVYPFTGFAPELGGVASVSATMADADVVGLGEAAHASAGFIGVKIRISRDLIERHGFRVVTWESSRVPARKLQRYVETCEGDPGEATKSLYAIWADVQTRDFTTWLCKWNQAHPSDKVQVHGYDVQAPLDDYNELAAVLDEGMIAGLSTCDRSMTGFPNQEAYDACKAGIGRARAHLHAHPELTAADIALTSFAGWQDEVFMNDSAKSFEARDIAMAKVFLKLRALHFAGKKSLVWAHNIHVVKRHETVAQSWVGGPIVTMGTQLDRELPGRYRTIAVVGMNVSLNRDGYMGPVRPAPSAGSLEAHLQKLGHQAVLIDLRHPRATDVLPAGMRFEMGAPGVEINVPAENYDGVLYLETSPMATLVP
jgi:erythromycin esterase-like protein